MFAYIILIFNVAGTAYHGFCIDHKNESVKLDGLCVIKKNDIVTIDGLSGCIMKGHVDAWSTGVINLTLSGRSSVTIFGRCRS